MTNEETRKLIEKYQKEHPLHFGMMMDVTAISSKEGVDIISQTIERVSKKVDEDTELWCICEMAKMYMQGVRPVYPVRPKAKWIRLGSESFYCSNCDNLRNVHDYYCEHCGSEMFDDNGNIIITEQFGGASNGN